MARKKTRELTPAQLELAKAIRESKDAAPLFSDAWRKVIGVDIESSGWRREYEFMTSRHWRFDFAHVFSRVAVEVDGGQKLAAINKRTGKPFAIGRHSSDEDHWKISVALSMGWTVFQFTPTQLTTDPDRAVRLVAHAMGHYRPRMDNE